MPPPYRGVGFCIYCGVSEARSGPKGLSDEHIVPLCLGGKAILPKASCEACAAITSSFEGDCASTIFAPSRVNFHWKSRKRKKPTTMRAFTQSGNKTEAVDVPLAEDAGIVALPELGPPPALIGQSYGDGLWQHGINLFFSKADSYEKLDRLSRKKIMTTIIFDPDAFARTLAKIGHAYAIAEIGYGNFRTFLNDPILDKGVFAGNYVGSMLSNPGPSSNLHEVSLVRYGVNIVALVRLYASHNGPVYHVVVGYP